MTRLTVVLLKNGFDLPSERQIYNVAEWLYTEGMLIVRQQDSNESHFPIAQIRETWINHYKDDE